MTPSDFSGLPLAALLVDDDGRDNQRIALFVDHGAAVEIGRLDPSANVDELAAKDVAVVNARLLDGALVLAIAQHNGFRLGRQTEKGACENDRRAKENEPVKRGNRLERVQRGRKAGA